MSEGSIRLEKRSLPEIIRYWQNRVEEEVKANSPEMMSCIRILFSLEMAVDEARREFPEADKEWAGYLEHPYRKWFEKWFGVTQMTVPSLREERKNIKKTRRKRKRNV